MQVDAELCYIQVRVLYLSAKLLGVAGVYTSTRL